MTSLFAGAAPLQSTKVREWLQRLFPKGGFVHSVSLLAGGTALAQLFTIVAAPVLTRIYRAEDFGYFQMYMSIMAFAAVAVTLRFEQAIVLPERDEGAADVFLVAFASVLVVTAVSAVVVLLVNDHYVLHGRVEAFRQYLWLVPIATFGAGFYQTLSAWVLRQKGYSQVSGTKVSQVGSQLGAQILIGSLHAGPIGLLAGDAIGRFTGIIRLARFAWRHTSGTFRAVQWSTVRKAAIRYRRFPLVSSTAALIGVAAAAVPPLLIAQLYGARTLGWFALGDRVLGAPTILIGQAISQVYWVDAAGFNTTNPVRLHSLFVKSAKILAVLGIAPYFLAALLAPVAFSFVFGSAWREAGEYARILALMHYVAFIAWPLTPTLNVLEQQVWQFAWDSGRLVLTVGSLWIVHLLGGSARTAIGAFGITMLIGYAIHLFLSRSAIIRRTRDHILSQPAQRPYVEV
jgi:O-antigen/teichoic acid export membrane protein